MKVLLGRYPSGNKERKVNIRIDKYDTWSMDHTLALIIHPMLIQLKATIHGAPWTEDEDVPDELKSTAAPPKENEWDTDANHFKRWEWILDEMIWAFERTIEDDGNKYYYDPYIDDEVAEPFMVEVIEEDGLTITKDELFSADVVREIGKFNTEKYAAFNERQKKAFILFGKYYRSLWD